MERDAGSEKHDASEKHTHTHTHTHTADKHHTSLLEFAGAQLDPVDALSEAKCVDRLAHLQGRYKS